MNTSLTKLPAGSCQRGMTGWATGFRTATLTLTLALLSGCSSVRLAYNQLDWLIIWRVDDYVPLTDAQESRLQDRVDQRLAWHCSTQLPLYNQWLDEAAGQARTPPVQRGQVVQLQDELADNINRILVEITPAAVELLKSTSDSQVASMSEAMAEGQREREEEFLAGSREEQIAQREKRIRDRAENWLDDLTDEQKRLIAQWNQERGDQTAIWLAARERGQDELREVMKNRNSPEFEDQITRLIQNSSEVRGPQYQAMLTETRAAMATLITDLINTSTPEQRQHLDSKINDLREDFAALVCDRATRASVQ